MNPFLARIGSLALAFCVLGQPLMARADASDGEEAPGPQLWYQGSRLIFADSQPQVGDLAVMSTDASLLRFLDRVGARLSYQSGQHYAVVTTAGRRQITFTVGESDVNVDGVVESGPFKIVEKDSGVLLPFYTLARALDIAAIPSLGQIVLEPQITGLDAHEDHARSVVMLHAAIPLHPRLVSSGADTVTVEFPGVGTSLSSKRRVLVPGLRSVQVAQTGTARSPLTTMIFHTTPQARAGILRSFDPHGVVLAFAPPRVNLHAPLLVAALPSDDATESPPPATPVPSPLASALPSQQSQMRGTPQPTPYFESNEEGQPSYDPLPLRTTSPTFAGLSSAGVSISRLEEYPGDDVFSVRIRVTGQPQYHWRILGDGRFFIDFPGARLDLPTRDETLNTPYVSSLRIRSNGTLAQPNVRLALGIVDHSVVHVKSDPDSLTVSVGGTNSMLAVRGGEGRVGGPDHPELALRPPSAFGSGASLFVPATRLGLGPNSRVIVLDPGHGGSDSGALGNGLIEKNVTLDIARRLRTLLISRGWQVVMTRDSDVDVYAANDSPREELQARCDVANRVGARLFVSIHVNSFTSPQMQGTTTYYYKPGDESLAEIVDQRLHGLLGTQDDGAKRENFYVVRHTTMPSILVETAFLSNPSDAARLNQPDFRQRVALAISEGLNAYTINAPPLINPFESNNQSLRSDSPVDDMSP